MIYHYLYRPRSILVCCLFLASAVSAYAQHAVSGKVVSAQDRSPLPGVSVSVKGSGTGAVTNAQGDYSLTVPDGDVILVFSSIGYTGRQVAVKGRSSIDISLGASSSALNELVVGAMPDRRGLIPEWQEKVLLGLGRRLQQLRRGQVRQIGGKGKKFTFSFAEPQKLNYLMVQEDLRQGERIRSWKLEGVVDGRSTQLASGLSIGNKRIVFFVPQSYNELRFTIDKDMGLPVIKALTTGFIKNDVI